ncbi:MAG TPA: hypothetical protein VII34_04720 [Pyrinomonadaceae bacterium]|jgi:hypothetical protein
MRSSWSATLIVARVLIEPSFAQKIVDPNAVAPEYREAAERRRAEQIRQRECARKADKAKIIPRDRTAYLIKCLAEDGQPNRCRRSVISPATPPEERGPSDFREDRVDLQKAKK